MTAKEDTEVLVLWGALASAHFLSLQVLVEQVKGSLVSLGTSHDSEHAFSGVIVRS
jgi:hypothetical protein